MSTHEAITHRRALHILQECNFFEPGEYIGGHAQTLQAAIARVGLLVLDPESDEDQQRVHDVAGHMPGPSEPAWGQRFFRALVAKPRPEEPKGLGAVVEDDFGARWVLVPSSGLPKRWCAPGRDDREWRDIAATHVLSEGWTP